MPSPRPSSEARTTSSGRGGIPLSGASPADQARLDHVSRRGPRSTFPREVHRLTAKGRKQLAVETGKWDRWCEPSGASFGRPGRSDACSAQDGHSTASRTTSRPFARETEDNLARGMAPDEARRHAILKFGTSRRPREATHAVWPGAWLEQLVQAAPPSARALGASHLRPLSLRDTGLGVGGTASAHGVARAVLSDRFPRLTSRRLVLLVETHWGAPIRGRVSRLQPDFARPSARRLHLVLS